METLLETLSTLHGLEGIHDAGTAEHSARVGLIAGAVGKALDLPAADMGVLRWGGILHDLGKAAIPREVLSKSGRLTDAEWAEVKTHPVVGADILLAISPTLAELAAAVRSHHERFDGSGYPDGLQGQEIPLAGRIIAVVDVYDALTHSRPYRRGRFTHEESVAFIVEHAGSDFDPEIVRVFVDLDRRGLIEGVVPGTAA